MGEGGCEGVGVLVNWIWSGLTAPCSEIALGVRDGTLVDEDQDLVGGDEVDDDGDDGGGDGGDGGDG